MAIDTAGADKSLMRRSAGYGLGVTAVVVALLAYWFAAADRYIVFLYFHDMGSLVPDTSPFSRVTASRYWMAGLVASGFVLVLYTAGNWLAGRLKAGYLPPPWQGVWLVSAPLLFLLIPFITMGLGQPGLPLPNTLSVILAALIGVALAIIPGKLAAQRPSDLMWLAADGWGLAFILMTLAQVDDIARWLVAGIDWRVVLSLFILTCGFGWLVLLTAVRCRRGVSVGDSVSLALAAACMTYLFLPFVHHVLGTDGYFYISDSDNFFAGTVVLQLTAWAGTAVIIWLLVLMRGKLSRICAARKQ